VKPTEGSGGSDPAAKRYEYTAHLTSNKFSVLVSCRLLSPSLTFVSSLEHLGRVHSVPKPAHWIDGLLLWTWTAVRHSSIVKCFDWVAAY